MVVKALHLLVTQNGKNSLPFNVNDPTDARRLPNEGFLSKKCPLYVVKIVLVTPLW